MGEFAKRDRVRAVLAGEPADRAPISLWGHDFLREWSPEDLDAFNMGLVRAHHFGTGAPFPISVVRNAMAIRVNTALTGRVEVATFKVITSTHDLFAASVRRALPAMRFLPAEVGGRKVKQLVQQPFVFNLTK